MKTRLFGLVVTLALLCMCTGTLPAQDTASTTARPPFDGMDLTWINGQNRQHTFPITMTDKTTGETILTGVAYLDAYYNYDFHEPLDNTHTISATIGRSKEFTLNLASIGMETNYSNIIGRIWLQTGNMLHIVQETDATVSRGRNTGTGNLKLIREAATGYHFDVLHGLNVEMGIFMSYIGLESYVTQENWCYQRSMVCDFTPFYFSGARLQLFPIYNYRTELWLLNGWQSYNSWNSTIGIGSSNYYRPSQDVQLVANFYVGKDSKTSAIRFHHDNSIVARYLNNPGTEGITQGAFSINMHDGFQSGNGVSPSTQYMTGAAVTNRLWFLHNKLGLSLRADMVTNPGLYLAFTPSPVMPNSFTNAIAADPAQRLTLWQGTVTLDVMPVDFMTFRFDYSNRQSNVPYFAGPGGTTSPDGWNDRPSAGWRPDLRKNENRVTAAVNFRL